MVGGNSSVKKSNHTCLPQAGIHRLDLKLTAAEVIPDLKVGAIATSFRAWIEFPTNIFKGFNPFKQAVNLRLDLEKKSSLLPFNEKFHWRLLHMLQTDTTISTGTYSGTGRCGICSSIFSR